MALRDNELDELVKKFEALCKYLGFYFVYSDENGWEARSKVTVVEGESGILEYDVSPD